MAALAWFEIPVTDVARAVGFYGHLFNSALMTLDLGDLKMVLLPEGHGALVQHRAYTPSHEGPLLFFDGGDDLSILLDRVEPAGGTVLRTKTQISPEQGYMALFEDPEGNRLGLRSKN